MAACQAVDTLAVNLPPDKFMPALLSHVQPALQRTDGGAPGMTKAAFNALAVSAEGCSEYIRTKKYLGSFLQVELSNFIGKNYFTSKMIFYHVTGKKYFYR